MDQNRRFGNKEQQAERNSVKMGVRRGSPRNKHRSVEEYSQPDFVRIGATLTWGVWSAVLRGLRTTPAGPVRVDRMGCGGRVSRLREDLKKISMM